jgi:anti-sigma-K factor RskA
MISAERREQASAYVLGALDEGERSEFERALESSEELRLEVAELRSAAAHLALAAAPVSPPPALRGRIMAEARSVRPIAPRVAEAARNASQISSTETARTPSPASRPLLSLLPWLAVAASLVGVLVMRSRYLEADRMRGSLATISDSLRGALAARDSLIGTLLAPGVETIKLSAAGRPPSARMFWNRASNQVVLVAFALPPAAPGRTYQLWGIASGKGQKPVSLGTFNTSANGEVRLSVTVPAGLQIAVGAVTEEPAGGSPQPTTTPFLVGQLQ